MGPRTINVALVGAGTIGRLHADTLAHHVPGARLVAAVEPVAGNARAAAQIANAGITRSLDEVLADADIHAVVIATPTSLHAELIAQAARAGKHVFCEKPIALTVDDGTAAVEAATACGVKLQIGFQRRFDSGYAAARDAVAAGELGNVELLISTTRDPAPPPPGYLQGCGGMFVDTAIHDFDSVRFLSGSEVIEVFATASPLVAPERKGPYEIDTAATVLRLATGALATVTNSLRTGYGYEAGAEIYGSKGKIVVGAPDADGVRRFARGGVWSPYPQSYRERFLQAYRDELVDFVRCIADDATPRVGGDDALRALEIALAATRSQQEGRPFSL